MLIPRGYARRDDLEVVRPADHPAGRYGCEERWFKRRVPGVGVTAELLLGYQLFRHLGVKGGVEVGGPWEMRFVQPRAVAVLSF